MEKVNLFVVQTAKRFPALLVFGSVHPHGEDPAGTVRRLYAEGIRGLKLHPDYLRIPFDDPAYHPVFEAAIALNMPIVIHAGRDPVSPDFIHAPPKAIKSVLRAFPKLKLICAHMGGMKLWDEVLTELCGENVWFDTAMCSERTGITPETARGIIDRHGADRILFGSDLPWARPSEVLAFLEKVGLTDTERDAILWKNAKNLFQI